jgi:hypothetical protein
MANVASPEDKKVPAAFVSSEDNAVIENSKDSVTLLRSEF